MKRDGGVSLYGLILFGLTLSSAASVLCLEWLGRAKPYSLGGQLADQTGRFIGHSALGWFSCCAALFTLLMGVVLTCLSRRMPRVILRTTGIISAFAVFACYWQSRSEYEVLDLLAASLALLTIAFMFMHMGDRWSVKAYILPVLIAYFGLFGVLLKKVIVFDEVLFVPMLGFVSSLVWVHDVKTPSE